MFMRGQIKATETKCQAGKPRSSTLGLRASFADTVQHPCLEPALAVPATPGMGLWAGAPATLLFSAKKGNC